MDGKDGDGLRKIEGVIKQHAHIIFPILSLF